MIPDFYHAAERRWRRPLEIHHTLLPPGIRRSAARPVTSSTTRRAVLQPDQPLEDSDGSGFLVAAPARPARRLSARTHHAMDGTPRGPRRRANIRGTRCHGLHPGVSTGTTGRRLRHACMHSSPRASAATWRDTRSSTFAGRSRYRLTRTCSSTRSRYRSCALRWWPIAPPDNRRRSPAPRRGWRHRPGRTRRSFPALR